MGDNNNQTEEDKFRQPLAPPPYEPPQQTQPQAVYQGGQTVYMQPGPSYVTSGVTVIPNITMGPQLGSNPQSYSCRNCSNEIVTKIAFKPSVRTHLMAALLCALGLWPCVCIPYCIDSCNDVEHSCPNCRVYLGTYRN